MDPRKDAVCSLTWPPRATPPLPRPKKLPVLGRGGGGKLDQPDESQRPLVVRTHVLRIPRGFASSFARAFLLPTNDMSLATRGHLPGALRGGLGGQGALGAAGAGLPRPAHPRPGRGARKGSGGRGTGDGDVGGGRWPEDEEAGASFFFI